MRIPLLTLLLLAASPLAAQTAEQITAGQKALKESLACRRPPETLRPRLEQLGFSPALVKDTVGFYTRELDRKRKLDAERAKFTVGDAPFRGPANAPVTIIEFSDFECPHCAHALPIIERVLREYDGRVRVAHKCFAFPQHTYAPHGCAAARAAALQGKYWQMHDWIFAHQEEIASLSGSDFGPAAIAIGLDWNRFKSDYARFKADGAFNARITKEGEAWGVQGTPAFFINGELLDGARPFEMFKDKIDAALLERDCAAPARPASPPAGRPAAPPAKPARRAP